jgi:phosphonate transport system substrate-binding protein
MSHSVLRFATFLAPSVFPVYAYISEYVGRQLGLPTRLEVGRSFAQFEDDQADVGFICGLPYVRLRQQRNPPVELLAAPVLQGVRYEGRPIYYSDVIVRADSPYRTFADLRGSSWSYNDPESQSGYGITLHTLVCKGETGGFFSRVIEAGFHQESIRLVCEGKVDASAIDSQVLAIATRDRPELSRQLRVIDSFGPSSIQPVVAASRLPDSLKADISQALISMAGDPEACERLAEGLFERMVWVPDSHYDDIRAMQSEAEAAGFTTIK